MEEAASLRRAAPCWNLNGDQQLLDALQNLHQRIILKCEEANTRMSNMASSLSRASLALHNVNNKFMSLSNSQFIESRVYDDDVDVTADTGTTKDHPQATPESDLEILKSSLIQLENMHETVTILNDSDSDSDSDDEDQISRVVLKPKDLYADRPLPHIIGSYAWKSKWHAGLLPEDSDTDSSASKPGRDAERYSDSEPDSVGNIQVDRQREATISSSTSERAPSTPPPLPPAAAAAALAQRLAAAQPPMPETEDEYTPPEPAVRKTYRPERPVAGVIFPDEPPPLDAQSTSSNDDIFAELHRDQHTGQHWGQHRHQPVDLFATKQAPADLFASDDEGDIFSDFAATDKPAQNPLSSGKQTSTLFEDDQEPELFAEKPKLLEGNSKGEDNDRIKKPVGGISLFGAKNSESIGAAILKRNQTRSSSDEEYDDRKPPQISKPVEAKREVPQNKKPEISKDIFDDLFAKSEKLQKNEAKDKDIMKEKITDSKEKVTEKKVDLFNDNLFDDIDDIFTTNIIKSKEIQERNTNKILFDDNDDLFADIAVTNTSVSKEIKTYIDKTNTKSIFDSDDDLFIEKPVAKTVKVTEAVVAAKPRDTKVNVNNSILFDSDDDKIFSRKTNIETEKHDDTITKKIQNEQINNNLFNKNEQISHPKQNTRSQNIKKVDQKGILQEDLEDDLVISLTEKVTKETSKPSEKNKLVMSPNLFDDDDELFTSTSKKIDNNNLFTDEDKTHKGTPASLNDANATKSLRDLKTQNEVKDAPKDEESLANKNVLKIKDDIFSEDILHDDEEDWVTSDQDDEVQDNIHEQENTNSFIKDPKPKQSKLDDIFDDDDDDSDIFLKHKPIIKETSKINIESAPKVQDTLKEKNEEDLFKTNKISTDIQNKKDVIKDEIKATNFHKPTLDTANKSKPIDSSKADHKQKIADNTIKPEINKNISQEIKKSNESISNLDQEGKPDNRRDVDSNKNITVIDNLLPEENIPNTDNSSVLETNKSTFDDIFNDELEVSKPKPDLFTDIFNDQPPIFEKPKERKRSQNVNALFDDDSDDEALFFKKNDVVLHDHPDEFTPDVSGDRFGIFHDEPPAIDVDFIQKANENDEKVPEEGIGNVFEHKIIKGDSENFKNKNDELDSIFQDQKNILPESKTEKTRTEEQETLKTHIQTPLFVERTNEPKRIGKLKPMNFNINVNTLLPGALPKKVQKEQTDGQTVSTKSNEELQTTEVLEQDESKLVKSVSFENEPDGTILDNKLSKERAKIQVKRRPSTRRARREAVKKSGIDFGEDSTDNSSSIDDHINNSKMETEGQNDVTVSAKTEDSEHNYSAIDDGNDTDMATTKDTDNSKDIKIERKYISKDTNVENVISSPAREVTSKVVYILNDEDIFNSKPDVKSKTVAEVTKVDHVNVTVTEPVNVTTTDPNKVTVKVLNKVTESEAIKPKQILNIVDDDEDDDIFKSIVTKTKSEHNLEVTTNTKNIKSEPIKTLNSDSDDDIFKDFTDAKKKESTLLNANTKTTDTKTEQKNIFNDLSDEENELFNKNKKETLVSNKNKTLFGSDSEEELFFGKKKENVRSNEKERVKENKIEVKGSLFGDDEDDELFSSKNKKSTGWVPFSSSRSRSPQSTQPVFDDPLSLFGNND